jgi:sugar phosphate isomerase/epimerase
MGWKEFNRMLHSRDYRKVLAGSVDPLDFATVARRDFGIDAIEWTNLFCFDRGKDQDYLKEMKRRADTEGVRILLIMCDAEGNMGDPDKVARSQTVANHHKWVEAARLLGCHSIRVNARSDNSLPPEEQQKLAADGLRQLCEFSDRFGINVLVENHGGLSSDGKWLAGVMNMVEHPRVGTLPDFGNFQIDSERTYDCYQGVKELMPYAKAVSAKSFDFDAQGNETTIDFMKMMRIVLETGYRGYVGIEYEGARLKEAQGIRATKDLLEQVRVKLAHEFG